VEIKGVNVTYVCNGEAGPTTTSLPAGQTSTGVWSFVARGAQAFETEVEGVKESLKFGVTSTFADFSFPLRLPAEPAYHWIYPGEPADAACDGTVSQPEADPGTLCVYAGEVVNAGSGPDHQPVNLSFNTKDLRSGLVMEFPVEGGKEAYGFGTWAVTAPAAP
jgi:hypothetical protein